MGKSTWVWQKTYYSNTTPGYANVRLEDIFKKIDSKYLYFQKFKDKLTEDDWISLPRGIGLFNPKIYYKDIPDIKIQLCTESESLELTKKYDK